MSHVPKKLREKANRDHTYIEGGFIGGGTKISTPVDFIKPSPQPRIIAYGIQDERGEHLHFEVDQKEQE